MAPGRYDRRKRGRWEQYNADFNADDSSQSSSLGEKSSASDKDAAGYLFKGFFCGFRSLLEASPAGCY